MDNKDIVHGTDTILLFVRTERNYKNSEESYILKFSANRKAVHNMELSLCDGYAILWSF